MQMGVPSNPWRTDFRAWQDRKVRWDEVHVYLAIIWGAMGPLKELTREGGVGVEVVWTPILERLAECPRAVYPRNSRKQIRKTTVLASNNAKDERR